MGEIGAVIKRSCCGMRSVAGAARIALPMGSFPLWLCVAILVSAMALTTAFAQDGGSSDGTVRPTDTSYVAPDAPPAAADVAPDVSVTVDHAPMLVPPGDQQPAPASPAATSTCGAPSNPWGFSYCSGSVISNPPASLCSVFACIPTFWRQVNGYVAQCRDGLVSHSGGVRGACSGHGGELQPLYAP